MGRLYGVKQHATALAGELAGTWDIYSVGGGSCGAGSLVIGSTDDIQSGSLKLYPDNTTITLNSGDLTPDGSGAFTGTLNATTPDGPGDITIVSGQYAADGYLMVMALETDPSEYTILVCIRQGAPEGQTFKTLEGDWYLADTGVVDDPADTEDSSWVDGAGIRVAADNSLTLDGESDGVYETDPGLSISSDSTGRLGGVSSMVQGRQHYKNYVAAFTDNKTNSDGYNESGMKVIVRYATSQTEEAEGVFGSGSSSSDSGCTFAGFPGLVLALLAPGIIALASRFGRG
jgi:hypothetical protein